VSDPAETGTVASDALADAAPAVETSEPVPTTTAAAVNDPTSDVSDPADTGTVASDALGDAAPVVETIEPAPTTTAAAVSAPTSEVSDPADTGTVASNTLADAAPVDEAAGDVIDLNDEPPPPENALHTGTEYTDYGVNLSSDSAVPPQNTGSSADAASASDTAPPPPEIVDTNQPTDPELALL
jgi:hypothetical protein